MAIFQITCVSGKVIYVENRLIPSLYRMADSEAKKCELVFNKETSMWEAHYQNEAKPLMDRQEARSLIRRLLSQS